MNRHSIKNSEGSVGSIGSNRDLLDGNQLDFESSYPDNNNRHIANQNTIEKKHYRFMWFSVISSIIAYALIITLFVLYSLVRSPTNVSYYRILLLLSPLMLVCHYTNTNAPFLFPYLIV